jgi:ABC-type glucose/galactose transport system permease subunit
MKHSIVGRIQFLTALTGTVLAFAALAHAGSVGTTQTKKTRTTSLNISAATKLGGITLQPGEYKVQQLNSATGPIVRFTRYTYDLYAPEGMSSHQWDTVGEVNVTLQALASKAAGTKLLLAPNGDRVIGVEIRGNNFDYLVDTRPRAEVADTR